MKSPGLEFLEGTYFWEALPRYADGLDTAANRHYRERVGINADGASVDDPKDVSTNSHMFGCWETLYAIKQGVEQSGYRSRTPGDVAALVEAMESFRGFNEGIAHPQGYKGVRRRAAPVLRAPVHLRGEGRPAGGGAHHVDRGRQVRVGHGLHHAVAVVGAGEAASGSTGHLVTPSTPHTSRAVREARPRDRAGRRRRPTFGRAPGHARCWMTLRRSGRHDLPMSRRSRVQPRKARAGPRAGLGSIVRMTASRGFRSR